MHFSIPVLLVALTSIVAASNEPGQDRQTTKVSLDISTAVDTVVEVNLPNVVHFQSSPRHNLQ